MDQLRRKGGNPRRPHQPGRVGVRRAGLVDQIVEGRTEREREEDERCDLGKALSARCLRVSQFHEAILPRPAPAPARLPADHKVR